MLCDRWDGSPLRAAGSAVGVKSSWSTRCSFGLKYLNSFSRPSTSGASRNVKEKRTGCSDIHSGQSPSITSRTACLMRRLGPPKRRQSPDRKVTMRSGSSSLCLMPNLHEAPTQRLTTGWSDLPRKDHAEVNLPHSPLFQIEAFTPHCFRID